jgi:eukaryotic-like serine/threonine-protein kinase
MAQARMALGVAHGQRILHPAIKPANLVLAKDADGKRTLRLLDFGVAKIKPDPAQSGYESERITRSGSVFGPPRYMSPEQVRGHARSP